MEVGLALGSNIGDRLHNLSEAKRRINATKDIRILDQSPVYETEPVETPDGHDKWFLNAFLAASSVIKPEDLLHLLKNIELTMGRNPDAEINAPRIIDIDIIYAGGEVIHKDSCRIPHPRWALRRFVVKPMADIRPSLVLPGETDTVENILSALPHSPKVLLFTENW